MHELLSDKAPLPSRSELLSIAHVVSPGGAFGPSCKPLLCTLPRYTCIWGPNARMHTYVTPQNADWLP